MVWKAISASWWVILVLGFASGALASPAAHVDEALRRALEVTPHPNRVAVSVVLDAGVLPPPGIERSARVAAGQERVLGALAPGAFRLKRRYTSTAGLSGWAQPAAVEALVGHPLVSAVYLDRRLEFALLQGVALIGADTVHSLGGSGAGVNVAVIDSGIDALHPDVADDLVHEQCFCSDHPSPQEGCCPNGGDSQSGAGAAPDTIGHGTGVAGIITSSGVVSAPGVAGGAGIVAIKVDGGGGPSLSDTEAALDWVLTNHAEFDIRVVNVSLSDEGQYNNSAAAPCSGSNIANTIRDLHLANVAVFVSSGNNGHDDGISLPACTEAISVGGVYDQASLNGTWCLDSSCSATCTDTNVDLGQFACFSNSDEILDILAPSWLTAAPDLDAGLQGFGGTSAAAAFASGAAALLIEETPTLTPGELRTLLKTHGPPVTNPENGLSFTRSDVAAAYPRAVVPTGSAHTLVVLLGLGGLLALRLIRPVEPPKAVTHPLSGP